MPPLLKHAAKTVQRLFNTSTASLHMLPDFIIIGAQRPGTTSLHNQLRQHPCAAPVWIKEIQFFDLNFRRGHHWYRAHFPSHLYQYYLGKSCDRCNRLAREADRAAPESCKPGVLALPV